MFSQLHTKKHDLNPTITSYITNVSLFFVGFFFIYISLRNLMPEDLFSTARFLDGMELAKVFETQASLTDDPVLGWVMRTAMGFDFPDVSMSAFGISFMIILVQIYAGYRTAAAGSYTAKSSNLVMLLINHVRGDSIDIDRLNWDKVGWLALWFIAAIFDTFTDIAFRSHGWQTGLILQSIVFSLIVYNILSECAFFTGITSMTKY